MNADVIVTDARVLTMDSRRPRASALATRDGRILSIGSTADIAGLRGPGTRVISAQNKTVLPGFIESHMHLFGGGGVLHRLDMTGLKGIDAVGNAVRNYVATQPEAKVLFGRGADYSMLGEAGPFTRHILDRMVPDRPFAISAFDFHTMWANTKALAAAGLLHGRELGPGNEIVMGDDGLATGELRESEAYSPLIRYSGEHRSGLGIATGGEPDPMPSPQEFATDTEMLKRGLAWCAKHGVTSIQNMDGNLYTLELLTAIEHQGGLLCRVKVPFHFKNFMKIEMLEKASLMAERYNSDWLSSGLVKAFCDGVLESYTAFMHDDYADRPGYRGKPLFSQEQFTELAVAADRRKLQMAVHCIGDGAVNRVLNSYEEARKKNGARDSRHRIEHVEVIIPSDVPRFKDLGVIASMQPARHHRRQHSRLHSLHWRLCDAPPPRRRQGHDAGQSHRAAIRAGARLAFWLGPFHSAPHHRHLGAPALCQERVARQWREPWPLSATPFPSSASRLSWRSPRLASSRSICRS